MSEEDTTMIMSSIAEEGLEEALSSGHMEQILREQGFTEKEIEEKISSLSTSLESDQSASFAATFEGVEVGEQEVSAMFAELGLDDNLSQLFIQQFGADGLIEAMTSGEFAEFLIAQGVDEEEAKS